MRSAVLVVVPVALVFLGACSGSSSGTGSSTYGQNATACPEIGTVTMTVGALLPQGDTCSDKLLASGTTMSVDVPSGTISVGGSTWSQCGAQSIAGSSPNATSGCDLACATQDGRPGISVQLYFSNTGVVFEYGATNPCAEYKATWQ